MMQIEDNKEKPNTESDFIKTKLQIVYELEIKSNIDCKYFCNEFPVNLFPTYVSLFKLNDEYSIEKVNQNGVYHGVLTKYYYPPGKWTTDVLIEKTVSSNIMIGIAISDAFPKPGGFYANTAKGNWMLHCANGSKYSKNASVAYYGKKVGAGEIVSVIVDLEAKTLSFAVNYIMCGKCYDLVFEGEQIKCLALAIDLYNSGDCVRLLRPVLSLK